MNDNCREDDADYLAKAYRVVSNDGPEIAPECVAVEVPQAREMINETGSQE